MTCEISSNLDVGYPLGTYVHMDIPNDYDQTKVSFSSGRAFGCCVSKASSGHNTWYVHKEDFAEFMYLLETNEVKRTDK